VQWEPEQAILPPQGGGVAPPDLLYRRHWLEGRDKVYLILLQPAEKLGRKKRGG